MIFVPQPGFLLDRHDICRSGRKIICQILPRFCSIARGIQSILEALIQLILDCFAFLFGAIRVFQTLELSLQAFLERLALLSCFNYVFRKLS
jgi:hypothetical protein